MSTTSNLFRRSMTSIDRFRKAKPVTNKSRRTRASILPGIDNLDERVLMAGNVSTSLVAFPGSLYIKGDNGNNTIQLTKLTSPDRVRVQGVATSVNNVGYKDILMSDFTSLQIEMGLGKDSVTLTDFKVASTITITTGNNAVNPLQGDDKIKLDRVITTTLFINSNNLIPHTGPTAQNAKSDILMIGNTITGTSTINTGFGNDSVVVAGGKYGNININTGANANFSVNPLLPLPVDAVDFSPTSAKVVQIASGVGFIPGGDYMIDVHDTTVTSLVICTGDALPDYACDCTILHDSHINVVNVDISKSVSGFTTSKWFVLCGGNQQEALAIASAPPASLFIQAGDNTNVLVDTVNGMAGDMDIKVGDNTWSPEFGKVLTFDIKNSTAKAMHFLIGDGNYDINIWDSSVSGGTGFTLDTQGTLGTGDKNITLFYLTVDGVTDPIYGDSYFLVTLSSDGTSNNTVSVDTVAVDVTSLTGSAIDGNNGLFNIFIDVNPGSCWGFNPNYSYSDGTFCFGQRLNICNQNS